MIFLRANTSSTDTMTKSIDAIISGLDRFDPDDINSNTEDRLCRLLKGFDGLADRKRSLPSMFALLEKYPEAYWGAPGPLVRAIEGIPGYEPELRKSLLRFPTPSTLWLANRILNVENRRRQRESWLRMLRAARKHPRATSYVKRDVRAFLDHQLERETWEACRRRCSS
jgi:hypothetical protein